MKFGISMFSTDTSATPGEVAAAVESYGFDSYWVSEHSHMPLDTKFPLADSVPREYSSMLDPFVALAAAACATQSIRLGTSICILTQHDPINTAKAVSSLDLLSNGRINLGIGAGWNLPEMRNHGTNPDTRFKLMRERVEAMRVLWTEEEAEYHGDLVSFEPVWQWPKPLQTPCPPVLIAGAGPNVINRVARYGDGWLPVVIPEATDFSPGRMTPMAEFVELVPKMRQLAAQANRPAPAVYVGGIGAEGLNVALLEQFEALEVTGINFSVPSASMPEVTAELDRIRAALAECGSA